MARLRLPEPGKSPHQYSEYHNDHADAADGDKQGELTARQAAPFQGGRCNDEQEKQKQATKHYQFIRPVSVCACPNASFSLTGPARAVQAGRPCEDRTSRQAARTPRNRRSLQ